MGAGAASVLVVHENVNPGWRATLDGVALEGVRVDGWQQGWRLPAGAAGTVRLDYAPDGPFRTGLLVGLVLAVVLVLGAWLPARRPAAGAEVADRAAGAEVAECGAGAKAVERAALAERAVPVGAVAALGLLLLGGLAGAVALVVAGALAWGSARVLRRPLATVAAALVPAAFVVAGVLAAVRPWGRPDPASQGTLTQAASLLALALLAVAVARGRRARAAASPDAPAGTGSLPPRPPRRAAARWRRRAPRH